MSVKYPTQVMKKTELSLISIMLAAFIFLVLPSCRSGIQEDEGGTDREDPADEISLTDEQIKMAGVISGKIEERSLSEELGCNGSVEVPPQSLITVSLPMGAYVKEIYFYSGSKIKKGELLAVMEHPDFLNLQREYLVTGNNLDLLRKNMERQETLAKEDASSEKKLLTAKTEYANARVHHNALGEQLLMLGLDPGNVNVNSMSSFVNVLSPLKGYIRMNYANIGELMNAGDPIMEIEDVSHLHVHLLVYEKDINRVRRGQKVKFTTGAAEHSYMGTVNTVGKSINKDSRAVDIHVHITNPDDALISGMYVKAKILLDQKIVYVIPETGIAGEGGQDYLFIRNGNTFTRVQVETGLRQEGLIEILSAGSLLEKQIVLSGAYYLNAGFSEEE